MSRRAPLAALALLIATAASSAAVEDLPRLAGSLALEDAVKLALAHNRSLLRAVEEREGARGRILEARADALPEVRIDASYERLDRELAFEIPSGPRVQIGYLDNYRADLVVTQPLFQGGKAAAAIRAAKLYREFADEGVRRAAEEAVYETVKDYYDALLAEEREEVARSNEKLSERLLADVETKRKFGVASEFQVLRARVDLSNARATLSSFRNLRRTALSDLFRTIGVSQDSGVELVPALAFDPVETEEAEALDEALRERPDLRAAALEVGLRKEAIVSAKSEYFPEIDLFFAQTWAKPDPVVSTLNEWGEAWRAGLTVSFTVFDGFRRKGRLLQERAALRRAELAALDLGERTRAEVRRAVLSVEDAAESVRVQEKTIEEAREGLRIAEVGFREGTLDQVAVLEARAALTQAQYLYFESLHAHAVARLDLSRARGSLAPAASGKEE